MQIDSLCEAGKLSVRASNVCSAADLDTVEDVKNYFEQYGTFKKIRNCGNKTEKELLDLCQAERATLFADYDEQVSEVPEVYPFVTPRKEEIFEMYIQSQLQRLPVRAKNGLNGYFKGDFSAKTIYTQLIKPSIDFKKLRNIGAGTVDELNDLKDRLSVRFNELIAMADETELEKLQLISFCHEKYGISEANLNPVIQIFQTSGRIPFFKLVEVLLDGLVLFKNPIQTDLFIHGFRYLSNRPYLSNIQIALHQPVSDERIRQLKEALPSELFNRLKPLVIQYKPSLFKQYSIKSQADFFFFDEEQTAAFNAAEGVAFTTHFYAQFFGVLLVDTHSMLGGETPIRSGLVTMRNRLFKFSYLVRKETLVVVRLHDLLDNFYRRISEKIDETYKLEIRNYIQAYFSGTSRTELIRVMSLCEQLIETEFDYVVKLDGTISIVRTKRKSMREYVSEVLENHGRLMGIEEIFAELEATYPGIFTAIDTVRSTVQREPETFIWIGRSSTYGLKAWESEVGVKGGTIRDIAEEYLTQFNEPKHIFEITEYIKKYRDTHEKNVYANLRLETTNRFVFYEGPFVGLQARVNQYADIQFRAIVGGWFIKRVMLRYNGCLFEKLIIDLASKHDVFPVQVRSVLINKIENQEARIDPLSGKIYFS